MPKRRFGTTATLTLDSILQNWKLAACAFVLSTTALSSVDLQTFGKMTIALFKFIDGAVVCSKRRDEKRRVGMVAP